MEIRDLQEKELPQLLALYRHLSPDGWLEEGTAAQGIWETIQALPGYHIIVAVEGGKVLSSCTLLIVPNLTHGGQPYGVVENVVTHPDYRCRGLATACLDYARKLAEKQRCYKLMLMTGSKRESTLRFYREAGYRDDQKTAFVQWLP